MVVLSCVETSLLRQWFWITAAALCAQIDLPVERGRIAGQE
jgi:hypothetical protein